jgi:hypothetical protein
VKNIFEVNVKQERGGMIMATHRGFEISGITGGDIIEVLKKISSYAVISPVVIGGKKMFILGQRSPYVCENFSITAEGVEAIDPDGNYSYVRVNWQDWTRAMGVQCNQQEIAKALETFTEKFKSGLLDKAVLFEKEISLAEAVCKLLAENAFTHINTLAALCAAGVRMNTFEEADAVARDFERIRKEMALPGSTTSLLKKAIRKLKLQADRRKSG